VAAAGGPATAAASGPVIASCRLKTLFLTGATGFIGSHAARYFLSRGWRVRALVRRPERPGLLPVGAEIVPGDLKDISPKPFEGADAVLHVAGVTKARRRTDYLAVNALGTEAMARAAAEGAPEATFVLVSSQSAAGPSRDGRPVRETDPARPVSWYGASKLEGERALERVWKGSWSIVRPSVVYGEGDPGMLQLFTTIDRGWAPILAGGACRIQLIWVGDLVRVLFAAAVEPKLSGRHGFAAGPPLTMKELALFVAALRRPPARALPLPVFAILAAGWIETAREAMTGRSRPFNRDKAREILQPDWICDAEPFLRDAGVGELRAWREGISGTIAWYRRNGLLASSFGEL